jgi:ubiquinone/menaquinone biosynthesis C-methylase UbiE
MDISTLKNHWNELGKADPLESILDRSGKRNGSWDEREFFATGEKEIDDVLELLKTLKIELTREKALDFGCGVGRLTQALARHFQEVIGVDIAPSMIGLANQYNRYGGKCRYILNTVDNLSLFSTSSIHFIYSAITLQHMHPRYSKQYLKEFLRTLTPDGILVFQIPSEPILVRENGSVNFPGLILRIFPKELLDVTYRKIRYGNRPRAEMYTVREKEIVAFLSNNGARILSITKTRGPVYLDCWYIVAKET